MRYHIVLLTAIAPLVFAQKEAAACAPLELVYARATTEPPSASGSAADIEGYNAKFNEAAQRIWSKGYGAAGYSLFTNLTTLVPGTTGYPVPYPATMDLGVNGGCMGVKAMAKRIIDRSKACPNMKFALGGHSQGGSVTTAAILTLPKETLSKIVAVTMFGTKPCSDIKSHVKSCRSYCNKGDAICDPASGTAKGGVGGPTIECGAGGSGKSGKAPQGPERRIVTPVASGTWVSDAVREFGYFAGQQDACGEEAAERGYVAKQNGKAATGMQAHLAYNSDGHYIKQAACYILKQYKEADKPAKVRKTAKSS